MWLAFTGQAVFFASWLIAGALEPHYSHVEEGVSELAGRQAENPAIVTVGLTAAGLSLLALAGALWVALGRRRALPVALFATAGLAILLAAVLPLDCGLTLDRHCRALSDAGSLSWQHYWHLWLSLIEMGLLLLTPFALARALWPGTAAAALLFCGAAGLAIAAASIVAYAAPGSADGLIQRVDLVVLLVWVLIVGVRVLWMTRGDPRTSDLIPMRPREFLARSWTGEGTLVLRPFFIGRFFAQRVEARRESVWISERVWRIDDEAHFGGGRFERRSMYCEFVSEDHVRLTADDLIDGADVWLEPEGFRLSEFRMAWPVGPLPVIMRCVDRSYFEGDGTFVNTIDLYSLGPRIPVARVTFRMRSSETAPTPQDSRWELDPA
ncbi:MAG: hypothetical protein QOH76_62 [Thermoleophilaceae bacterium]|nr:hypothetical protein [Thermoleophilaceae bacterium]